MFYLALNDEEYKIMKEYRNPSKWEDWRELPKKLRFVLQRLIIDQPGGHKILMEIAKEASHNLDHHRWCGDDCMFKKDEKEKFLNILG